MTPSTANKVSLRACSTYDEEEVFAAVSQAINDLGGIRNFAQQGERVMLKANLLMEKRPEDATLTHPAVLKALARLFIENDNTVIIGDSPGGPFTEGLLNKIYKTGGYNHLAEQTGAILNTNFNIFHQENPEGLLLKRLTLTDMLNDVDKVVSVSKLKTHGMMTFTGAVKNMFGTIPGIMKAEYHLNMPEYDDFANALIDICLASKPTLSVMDGVVGMEGHGPSAGDPRQLGVILASDSPFALDRIACDIISLSLDKVPTLKNAAKRRLCPDITDIEVVGDNVSDFKVTDFVIPKPGKINPSQSLPPVLKSLISKILQPRPVFLPGKCVKCNICADNCPIKVITLVPQDKPKVDLDKCIRCYCCQELCPAKAIVIKRPLLMRLFIENAFSKVTSSIIRKITAKGDKS